MMEENKKEIFRINFRSWCTIHFKTLSKDGELSKLKILPKEEVDTIIETIENFNRLSDKTAKQYKWFRK